MPGGIAFNETMEGWFALGARTPDEGSAQGQQKGNRLAMHARIVIDDLDRFITVREHPGGLTGTIDFQPWGMGLSADSGVFQLFAPDAGSDLRRMVYELAFRSEAKDFYLAGEKLVKNDAGVDLWRDTTTLYTTLHQGMDRSGPVVGAGILSLGVPQLLALISTLKPINGGDFSTVGTFGRFFFGQLWDIYAPHLQKT
jgi:cholesterol oxidase